MRVGLVGLGRMGSAIVPHLVAGCASVVVWNRSAQKCAEAADAGATVASSLRDAVEASDVVLSILFDDSAVEAVYLGSEGLLAGRCEGRLFVEMSTIKLNTTRRLAAAAAERGANMVDAPVSGSVQPAREGKLLVLAGGSAADIARATPVLSLFARRVVHVGPSGSGISAKLALQLPIYAYWQALGEALSIAARAGLGAAEILPLIADSPAALAMLKLKIPVIMQEEDAVAFALSGARKDLSVIVETARGLDVDAPAAETALAAYSKAASAGLADQDVARLVSFLVGEAVRMPIRRDAQS
jgi:3-hydroxyisobutyrate dehydrogenase